MLCACAAEPAHNGNAAAIISIERRAFIRQMASFLTMRARTRALARRYGAATAKLTILSPCSLRIRSAASSFDIARLPNCSRNMPPLVSMIVAR